MIERIWLLPPLAFGRLGPSATPCPNFRWGHSDLSPRGTGKTTIEPAETLAVAADGTPSAHIPDTVVFTDESGFRPICPFFEVHGSWTVDGTRQQGNVTVDVLARFGLGPADVRWRIEVANLKPFHITLINDDRITATVEVTGASTTPQTLHGRSPAGAANPLVPAGSSVPLGTVQVVKPTSEFPELRLRFVPPGGAVYGPADLPARTARLPEGSPRFVLPDSHLMLNPSAAWCSAGIDGDDPRTNPGGLFAGADVNESLGLVDDVSDGLVSCRIGDLPPALGRIAVGPPDYAPDRRPFVSIADGLADRVRRADVREPAYLADEEQTRREIQDLMERIRETVDNINLDVQNDRGQFENERIASARGLPPEDARARGFTAPDALPGRTLPLTEAAREHHRRFVAAEVLEDLLREDRGLIERIVRPPMTGERYYDRRMPAMMRGSDRYPMHVTRRQYDLLVAWAAHLRQDVEPGT